VLAVSGRRSMQACPPSELTHTKGHCGVAFKPHWAFAASIPELLGSGSALRAVRNDDVGWAGA
jgi:hypothetical protein